MALHLTGTAPFITDGDVVLAEIRRGRGNTSSRNTGRGRLTLSADHPDFAQFLYWFHFANGTLQAGMGRLMLLNRLKLADDNQILLGARARVDRAFDLLDGRAGNAEYLAGDEFTSADIMTCFSLTTMRYFQPYDLGRYPNIVGYLARIAGRQAYRQAMEKGDPGMSLLLT